MVARLKLDAVATLADLSDENARAEALQALAAAGVDATGDFYAAVAQTFGVDVIYYPYGETHAYVVKNGTAIVAPKKESVA